MFFGSSLDFFYFDELICWVSGVVSYCLYEGGTHLTSTNMRNMTGPVKLSFPIPTTMKTWPPYGAFNGEANQRWTRSPLFNGEIKPEDFFASQGLWAVIRQGCFSENKGSDWKGFDVGILVHVSHIC